MIFTNNTDEAKKYIEKGFDAVANNTDNAMFMQVYDDMVKKIRG